MKLTVHAPHRPGTIPILSTHHINHNSINNTDTHTCSTLNSTSTFSWSRKDSIYTHLNRERCIWEFTKWLPVEDLLQYCGGQRNANSIVINVNRAYMEYIVPAGSLTLSEEQTSSGQTGYTTISTPFLPPPLHTYTMNGNGDAYIFPLTMQDLDSAVWHLYFYSLLPLEGGEMYMTSSSVNLTLLHEGKNTTTSKQAWLLELNNIPPHVDIPIEFQLNNQPPCGVDCGTSRETLTFSLALTRDNGQYRPALRTAVTLQHNPDMVSNYTESFTLGKIMIIFVADN